MIRRLARGVPVVWVLGGMFGSPPVSVSSTHSPGGVWSPPASLAAEGLQLDQGAIPGIAVTAAGESIAVWPAGEASTVQEASRPPGGAWSAPTTISAPPSAPKPGSISDLQIQLAPSGEALAIWSGFDGGERVIEAATRPAQPQSDAGSRAAG